VDIDRGQLARHPATVAIAADCAATLEGLAAQVQARSSDGAARAGTAREAAWRALPADMKDQVRWIEAIRDAVPGALIVGDSTQPIYAANLFYDHDRPGGWFNAATGF